MQFSTRPEEMKRVLGWGPGRTRGVKLFLCSWAWLFENIAGLERVIVVNNLLTIVFDAVFRRCCCLFDLERFFFVQLLNPPEEIESMADAYFQRIYTSEQSIEEVRLVVGTPVRVENVSRRCGAVQVHFFLSIMTAY